MDMLGKPWMREVILEHYQVRPPPLLSFFPFLTSNCYHISSLHCLSLRPRLSLS